MENRALSWADETRFARHQDETRHHGRGRATRGRHPRVLACADASPPPTSAARTAQPKFADSPQGYIVGGHAGHRAGCTRGGPCRASDEERHVRCNDLRGFARLLASAARACRSSCQHCHLSSQGANPATSPPAERRGVLRLDDRLSQECRDQREPGAERSQPDQVPLAVCSRRAAVDAAGEAIAHGWPLGLANVGGGGARAPAQRSPVLVKRDARGFAHKFYSGDTHSTQKKSNTTSLRPVVRTHHLPRQSHLLCSAVPDAHAPVAVA